MGNAVLHAWLDYFAGANTTGADTKVHCPSVYNRSDPLKVGQPASAGVIVCMTHVATGDRSLSTYGTYF